MRYEEAGGSGFPVLGLRARIGPMSFNTVWMRARVKGSSEAQGAWLLVAMGVIVSGTGEREGGRISGGGGSGGRVRRVQAVVPCGGGEGQGEGEVWVHCNIVQLPSSLYRMRFLNLVF